MANQNKVRMKKIREMCEKYPDEVMLALLDVPFWPEILSSKEAYIRFDDDTPRGHISITFSHDGDGWIDVVSNKDPDDLFSHRFRTYFGGGQSLRVNAALKILAVAIHLDNQQFPQKRG
jgi:hypothetical protein